MEGLSSGVHNNSGILQSSPKRPAYEDLLGLPERRRKDPDAPASSATPSTVPVASDVNSLRHSDIYDVLSRSEDHAGFCDSTRKETHGVVTSGGYASATVASSSDSARGVQSAGGTGGDLVEPPVLPDPSLVKSELTEHEPTFHSDVDLFGDFLMFSSL